MQHYFEMFLDVFFWVLPVYTVVQMIYSVKLKSRGLKFKDQDFLSMCVTGTLWVMSIIHKFF